MAPGVSPQLEAKFQHPKVDVPRPQPAASGVLAGIQPEQRPVLNPVVAQVRDFGRQSRQHLCRIERAAGQPGHLGIAPEASGKGGVVLHPLPEAEARGGHEIGADRLRTRKRRDLAGHLAAPGPSPRCGLVCGTHFNAAHLIRWC